MVPRTEILAVDLNTPLDELQKLFIDSGHSKILIYENSIDNIIGYFKLNDLFTRPKNIRAVLRKLLIVPESMPAQKLLQTFVEGKKSIALVVDEFGGTSGMVTIEDVLEEIFGEIEDEHDTIELTEKQINENEFILSGRHEIDYLNEKYNLYLPDKDEYETLAGWVLYHHGSIPVQHERIIIAPYEVQVLKASQTQLQLVRLTQLLEE
jgi:CBS domain containing-hemolysin-like protein